MAHWMIKAAGAAAICALAAGAVFAAPGMRSEARSAAEDVVARVNDAAAPPASDKMKLVWQDEFNGDALDPAKWNLERTTPQNPGMGEDEFSPDHATVKDGILELKATPMANGHYLTALVTTRYKAFWKHGRFEARMKVPSGDGTNSAFWMMPNVKAFEPWPKSGEIDIAEKLGREPTMSHGTIHFPGERLHRDHGVYNRDGALTEDLSKDFHVYAVEWNEGSFEWFLDGKPFHRTAQPSMAKFPFNRPFFVIFNLSFGGKWAGAPKPDQVWPMALQIDWVRVYQTDADAKASAK